MSSEEVVNEQPEAEQVEAVPVDGNSKVADLTVNQLFNVLNACVDRAHRAAFEGAQKAMEQAKEPKILTPNFTPQSAKRYARRHPDA